MNSLPTKRKMFAIATGIFLVSMATTFLFLNENQLNIDGNHLQTSILSTNKISTVQDEATLRKLVGISKDDFLIVKIDRTLRFISSNILENHEFEEHELKDLNILTLIHPKDLPSLANTLMVYHQEKIEKNNIGPLRVKTKSGSYIPYMASLKPIVDDDGEIIETVVVLKDVSTPLGEIEDTRKKNMKIENSDNGHGNDIDRVDTSNPGQTFNQDKTVSKTKKH